MIYINLWFFYSNIYRTIFKKVCILLIFINRLFFKRKKMPLIVDHDYFFKEEILVPVSSDLCDCIAVVFTCTVV